MSALCGGRERLAPCVDTQTEEVREMSADCIFCRIVSGEIPSTKVYEDERTYAFEDINPQAPIHVLVVPKQHVEPYPEGLSAVDADMLGALFHAAEEVARAKVIATSGFRLIVNVGPDSGQEVAHLHMHVLGGAPVGPLVARRA